MPLRFNQKELVIIASKPDENFDKQGVLSMRESEGKLFHKTEKFTERFVRLRGNLLFYFKSKEQTSEVAGIIVLDHSEIHISPDSKQFSFVIEFKESDEQKYELVALSEKDMKSWVKALKKSGYQNVSAKIAELRREIAEICGQDPLPDHEPLKTIGGDSSSVNVALKKSIDNSFSSESLPARLELCIACTGTTSLYESNKIAYLVKVSTMTSLENIWSNHSHTEICEDIAEPFFLKTISIEQKFPLSTRLKFTVCDVKNRSKNQAVSLGQAFCSLQDIELSLTQRLTLPIKAMESTDVIGSLVIQGWKPTSGMMFSRRQDSVDFIRDLDRTDDALLSRFPRTFVAQIVEKSFRFPTKFGDELRYQELMGESLLSFRVPVQLLELFVQEEKEAVLELHRIGDLNPYWENVKLQLQNRHFELVRLYTDNMSELSNYEGRNFKRSLEKSEKDLEFVTTNLHLQRMRICDSKNEEFCYDIITFGSPAAHSLKFRHGGLKRLLSSAEDSSRRMSINPTDSNVMIAGKKARNIKRILKEEADIIISLCNKISSSTLSSVGPLIDKLSKKIAEILNLVSSSFIQEAEMELIAARQSNKTNSTPTQTKNDGNDNSSWRWTGTEFKNTHGEQIDQDCGLRDALASFMSLVNDISNDQSQSPDSRLEEKMQKAIANLSKTVDSFTKKFSLIMRFILMKEEGTSGVNIRDIHYRRDIVFSQTLAPTIAGFVLKVSENIENRFFLDQISTLGVLFLFECLITPHGEEMGMLEDTIVGFDDLKKVRFKFMCNNVPDAFPVIEGNRCLLIVSIPLHESHFKKLPSKLQDGHLIPLHPIAFNIAINEHATIAERFGDMSLQEYLNSTNLNYLFSYYEKFSSAYPDWVGTRSEQVISLPMLMANLKVEIKSKKSKNTHILRLAEEICWRMNGIRLTSCKSAKDRTAMAVTLEATRILEREHGLRHDMFLRVLSTIRSQGTRLINSFKNVGIPKYAFNKIQVKAYPSIYRAPDGTCGKNVVN